MINKLVVNLIVVQNFSKDIHYTCHGDSFYAKHLLADRFNFDESIDLIKECCLLGRGVRPLASKEYLKLASEILTPPKENDDRANFLTLQNYIQEALHTIEALDNLTKADENVVGGIAQFLQQYYGLINLQVEE